MSRRVYFIRPVGMDGPVKIGASRCPEARLIECEAASPMLLEMIATLPEIDGLEYRLHGMFQADRHHGEWFNPSPALAHLIESVKAGTFDHTAIPATRLTDAYRRPRAIGAQSRA